MSSSAPRLLSLVALSLLSCSRAGTPSPALDSAAVASSRPAPPTAAEQAYQAGVEWVSVPSGSFVHPCAEYRGPCVEAELTRAVQAFQLMAAEVTQAEYSAVTGGNPSYRPKCGACPVEHLTWQQASDFCARFGWRLPTVEEWLYAARAGTKGAFPCGDDPQCVEEFAWHADNAGAPRKVRTKKPNPWGLFDMLGNVDEWVAGRMTELPGVSADSDPEGFHAHCGGSFAASDYYARNEACAWVLPTTFDDATGFRCARSMPK